MKVHSSIFSIKSTTVSTVYSSAKTIQGQYYYYCTVVNVAYPLVGFYYRYNSYRRPTVDLSGSLPVLRSSIRSIFVLRDLDPSSVQLPPRKNTSTVLMHM